MTSFLERLTTPLLPADYLDVIDPLLSRAHLRGRVTAVHPETRDSVTLVIRPGRGWRPHRPGQFLRLGVAVDGVRHWRSYSLTGPRRPDGCLSITVKAVPGGVVSNHLVRRISAGTLVHLDQPAGEFTLGTPAPPALLFLTAGSGITPVMGMLRALPADHGRDILLVHSAPAPDEVIFGGELRMLARRGRIRLVEVHTRTGGRLDIAGISTLAGDISARHTWACGPAGFLESIEEHWAAADLSDRLRTERFRPARTAVGEGGVVSFARTGATAPGGGDRSLLEIGESAGVLMPSGCRMGICFGCVAPLRRGAVRDLRNGTLTTAAEGDGVVVQTCVSAPAGDCDLDL